MAFLDGVRIPCPQIQQFELRAEQIMKLEDQERNEYGGEVSNYEKGAASINFEPVIIVKSLDLLKVESDQHLPSPGLAMLLSTSVTSSPCQCRFPRAVFRSTVL